MIIKKYQAANEADAIILAKEDLGKNVIIMNVKKINSKGMARLFKKSKVEVTAAIDDEKSYSKDEDTQQVKQTKKSKKDKTDKNKQKEFDNQMKDAKKKDEIKKVEKKEEEKNNNKDDLKEEIIRVLEQKQADMLKKYDSVNNDKKERLFKEESSNSKFILKEEGFNKEEKIKNKEDFSNLQSIIKKEELSKKEKLNTKEVNNKSNEINDNVKGLNNTIKEEKSDKYVKLIKKQLLKHEVDEKYIDMIINEVKGNIKKDTLVDNILTSVYQKIILKLGTPKLIEPGDNQPRYVFFMGPTGVGKTTTIAKIASDFKLNRKLNIALLTSDTYRIAAVEQLRIYANILKVPLNVAYNAEDIKKLKNDLDRYDVVLIDTAGRSHKNKEQNDDLRELISTIDKKDRDIYLVLSATTKYSDLINIVEAYNDIEDYKLLFTKTDETTHLGNILNIKLLTNAKLSYIANGQDVPTDIGKVDAQEIAKQLLGGGV